MMVSLRKLSCEGDPIGPGGVPVVNEDSFDVELLDFCYLCARQFFQDPEPLEELEDFVKEESILELFLGKSGTKNITCYYY